MAATEKVSLSLDSTALRLARRAAVIEGTSLSAYLSNLVMRHAWDSERPALSVAEQQRVDERDAELDEQEWHDGQQEHRAAG